MSRGGARIGAGRPIEGEELKKNRTLKATTSEWNLIQEFAKIIKHGDKQAAKIFISQNKVD